jgi:phage terminase Nu1 subunit (DNA packaging protein)
MFWGKKEEKELPESVEYALKELRKRLVDKVDKEIRQAEKELAALFKRELNK